mmetsp:Transcript_11220/g.13877  ORF Transcript_11220/g.13877 Transcript_11220/m.13877 type:complete len:154 (-) Transcript_11220:16-477(-)
MLPIPIRHRYKENQIGQPAKVQVRSFNTRSVLTHSFAANTVKCTNCDQAVTGRSIKVGEWTWHIECFVCAECRKSLIQQAWCKYEGKCYCQEDYNKLFAPKCGRCGNILTESYITALNKCWHKSCFTCFNCGTTLSKFEQVNGEPSCSSCASK